MRLMTGNNKRLYKRNNFMVSSHILMKFIFEVIKTNASLQAAHILHRKNVGI